MQPLENEKSKNWSERALAVSTIVMAVSSVLTLSISILTNVAVLPVWIVYFPLVVFVAALFFLVYSNARKILVWWRKRAVAGSSFPNLITLAKEFANLTTLRLNDTIVYGFGKIPESGPSLQNREFAELCEWVTNNLVARLENSKRKFNELKLGIRDLHTLVHSFHRVYFIEGMKKASSIEISNIPEDNKKIIEVARENFARYLDKFQSLCNEINERLGRKEFDYYFEKAKPL